MISKEVLAKVNELIALATTKKHIHIEIQNYTSAGTIITVSKVLDDCSSIYYTGGKYWSEARIQLDYESALLKLQQVLAWLNTLEDATI